MVVGAALEWCGGWTMHRECRGCGREDGWWWLGSVGCEMAVLHANTTPRDTLGTLGLISRWPYGRTDAHWVMVSEWRVLPCIVWVCTGEQ